MPFHYIWIAIAVSLLGLCWLGGSAFVRHRNHDDTLQLRRLLKHGQHAGQIPANHYLRNKTTKLAKSKRRYRLAGRHMVISGTIVILAFIFVLGEALAKT